MALKLCRECKKEISTDANPCPHCGKKNPHGMSKLLKYGGGAVGALIIIGVAASSSKTQEETKHNAAAGAAVVAPTATPSAAPSAAPAPKSADLTVDAIKLWKDYDANEVAADGLYKGKNLQVTGVVASIDKDFLDNIVLHLKSPNELMNTMATLKKSESDKAAALKKGGKITLICKGKGRIIGSPSLGDCTISGADE